TQDHSIYIEIGRVDYSKPFFAISIASKLYASQTPFIARNYGYYLFKDSEGFYLLSMYAGKITALGKHVTVQQLIDAEVNPHYATKLCFNAGIGLDDIEINTGKQGGIRAFPQAKWHNDLFLIGEKRQNIFGIMLSNYSTKGEVEDHYDSATGMLVRNVQYYLDTANKEIVCVYPKQNYF